MGSPDPATARPLPPESEAGRQFWAATRERRFVLPWCEPCDEPHWYPRGFCPGCLSEELDWRESRGRGAVYAVSVQPKAAGPGLADRVPYAVALVDLAEGVRMMLGVVTDDPSAVAIGDRVTVGWEPLTDGRHLPVAIPDGP
ncbi:Zn-ribbon domain-containing OB-fold protein [soil metagenome]